MLKSCWDCVSGYSRDQADNEVAYNGQQNGHSLRAPPWPTPREQDETMFILPKKINSGDKIGITGVFRDEKKRLTITLLNGDSSPDDSNIACQFEAKFPSDASYENIVTVKMVENGRESIFDGDQLNKATDIFKDSSFRLEFLLRVRGSNGPMMDIYMGQFPIIGELQLKHSLSDIKFLSVSGDVAVQKLDFDFAY